MSASIFPLALTQCETYTRRSQRGFTIIELTVVIVIMGILGAAAAPLFFDNSIYNSRGFHDQVVSTLRYAQKSAIAQRRFVCVAFTANSITLTFGGDSTCANGTLTSPSGTPYPLTSKSGTFSPTPPSFSFDCLGRPRSVGGGATCAQGNLVGVLSTNQTVTVQGASNITVWHDTGYVY